MASLCIHKGILLKTKTSKDYVPTKFNQTIDFIKDFFTTHVPETEDMEVDSPSFLNRAMDESEWEQMPSFVSQVDAQSHYQALPRDINPIEKDLDTWLKHTEASDRTDIDIITYWKEKADKMPLLAKVARTFFGLPVTSASSERLFSAAGNVVTSARTLLNSERAEQLIFIHDNYWLVEPTIKSMKIILGDAFNEEKWDEIKDSGIIPAYLADIEIEGELGRQTRGNISQESHLVETTPPPNVENNTENLADEGEGVEEVGFVVEIR